MTDTEMFNGGAPKVKRGRGRPRKSESEKAETAARRAAKTKAERAERKAQQRLQAQAVTHGHPPPSTSVPNTVPLPHNSRDTHQLRLCASGMTNSHSHPERASGDAQFTLEDIADKIREQDEMSALLFGRRSASREGPMGVLATTSPPAGQTSSPAPVASMQMAQADRGMIYPAQPDESVPVSTSPVLTTAPVPVPSMQMAQADRGMIYSAQPDESAPVSTSPVLTTAPVPVPSMQKAQADEGVIYPTEANEEAPVPPANTGVERVSQSSTTPTGSPGEDEIRNLLVGGKNPRNEKQYRLLSNDMLVKKLQRAEPGLPCNWCIAAKNNDFGVLTPTSTDLSKRIICDYCIKGVLCKIEHANHGKWSPLVLPPQIASPQCDVCLGRHAVVICGDCPLMVCTVCQLSLDGTWEASGNLDRMIENLHWLGVRDDAIFLHSESREFPTVLQQLTPPARHLVRNRFGDNELLTDAEIEADNILAETYGSFPSPTLTPEAKYDEYGHYMGGLDEEGLLPHQEFHYCDPSVFDNLQ
ncbi:MAG: hypothetical protein M1835_007761 [Candelina submexicana]|nr:MAG: hypothetical protein M1835_007761 [Candelina submexicana]